VTRFVFIYIYVRIFRVSLFLYGQFNFRLNNSQIVFGLVTLYITFLERFDLMTTKLIKVNDSLMTQCRESHKQYFIMSINDIN